MTIKYLIAANWKMNGQSDWAQKPGYLSDLLQGQSLDHVDALICPSPVYVAGLALAAKNTSVEIGAQDCHPDASGAHTGDTSAAMIKDVGASHCIVGHSERRADHNESSEIVRAKAQAAHKADLTAVICVGETREQRESGAAETVVGGQLAASIPSDSVESNTVIAYEPVWAIGTGLTPSLDDINAMHSFIRGQLAKHLGNAGQAMRILYGGSVKPANAQDILAIRDVNGALVGGASLEMESFAQIILAAQP